jgi:purine-binding chemotaxis protein CheW
MADTAAAAPERIGQYLSFKLDDELFAMDVACVREVIDRTELTRIPRMPEFMRGVINLRGNVVPVVDLRMKFGIGQIEMTIDTCIVVLEVNVDEEATIVGALVDAVEEVFELEPSRIEPPPKMGTRLNTEFIEGMGRLGEDFVILLNADRVFSALEMEAVQSATRKQRSPRHPAKKATTVDE